MKKIILIVFLVMLGLCLAYVLFNRIDAKADPNMFSVKDLPAANFDYENGYYRLWTLGLPESIDVESAAVKEKYRRLFDPQFDNDKEIREFDREKYKQETNANRLMNEALLAEVNRMDSVGAAPPFSLAEILVKKEEFIRFRQTQPLILRRYEALLESKVFQDFSAPKAISPIPNLLLWLRLNKLYLGLSLVDASEGKWMEAAAALLQQAELAKKAVAGSRILITNLVAKAVLNLSSQGLAFLMNQRDCPTAVFLQILENMPLLRLEEYGSRNGFISEFLFSRNVINRSDADAKVSDLVGVNGFLAPLGLQENRTLNECYEFFRTLLDLESSPLQSADPMPMMAPRHYRKGLFWWVQNPVGKIFLSVASPNLGVVVFKALRTKSLYDMTRISAELHLRYDPAKSVQENLDLLASYQTVDPCSGKPYIWNEDKQILYSIGIDRVDGGGTYDRETIRTDVVLPCVLYLRADVDQHKNK